MTGAPGATDVTAREFSAWRRHFPTMQTDAHWVENAPHGRFEGRLSRRVAGGVSVNVIRVRTEGQLVERTPDLVRRRPGTLALAAVQLSGTSALATDRGVATLTPGDHVVFRWGQPSQWRFPGDFTIFVAQFPESYIRGALADHRAPLGEVLGSGSGTGPLLVPYVHALAQNLDLLNGPVGHRIARSLADMVATELLAHCPREVGGPADLFARAAAQIDARLADPDLGVGTLADALFVSRRVLQTAFESQGTTVTAWIRVARLEAARADLADAALSGRSIAQIARERGFTDPTHFSHAFRARFGHTPRQCRERARDAHPPAVGQMP